MALNLAEYIKHPSLLSKESESELIELQEKFPYFQILPVLLAKCYKNQDSFSYNKSVKLASLYAGERKNLFRFLHQIEEVESIAEVAENNTSKVVETLAEGTETQETFQINEDLEHESLENFVQPIIESIPEETEESEGLPISEEVISELIENEEHVIRNTIPQESEPNSAIPVPNDLEKENENLIQKVVEQEWDIEPSVTKVPLMKEDLPEIETPIHEAPPIFIPDFEKKPAEEIDLNGEIMGETNTTFSPETTEKPILENAPDIAPNPIEETEPETIDPSNKTESEPSEQDFFAWLDDFKMEKQEQFVNNSISDTPVQNVDIVSAPPEETINKTPEAVHKNPIPLFEESEENEDEIIYDPVSWAEIAYDIQAFKKPKEEIKQPNKDQKTASKEEIDALLDRFIKKSPSISRVKAELYKPENMAKRSEEFHLDIASESLAALFYKQGHLHKSLEIYEKLLLQNPDKKEIFAARIKLIKEELINRL